MEGKKDRSVVVTVKLPKQLFETVEEYRKRYGLARSDIIRIALAEYFNARRKEGG
jgi:metal-responsive CopG/Arc/MetJ family transcriptional regulator